jgi:drug/metabolite transporter (DMT)-like permease
MGAMKIQGNAQVKGALYSLLGFSLFSIGDAIYKYYSEFYSIYMIGFLASVSALAILLMVAFCQGGPGKILKTSHLKLHLVRGALLSCQFLCVIYALSNLPMANTYALFFAAPLLTALLSIPVLNERAEPLMWIAILTGFIGVLVILRPGLITVELASLAALAAALLFAFANLAARFIGDDDCSPLAFGIYVEFVIVPVTGLLCLSNLTFPPLPDLAVLCFAGALAGPGLVFIAKGFTAAPASVAAPFQYIQMLWAIMFGYFVFGDTLDLWMVVGSVLIIVSGIWIITHEKRSHQDPC